MLSQFPLCPITNETLESKGSLETIGFKRRFLHTFCCCWQKVCRRRQKTLCEKETRRRQKRKATGNISRRRHVPYEKGPAGRKAPAGDTAQKYSSASEMLPTQKGTCHGTFLFAGHFFGSVVIRLLPCFSFAPQGRGCCWVMQWILPPPKATSRVCTPTTSRSGNISCT